MSQKVCILGGSGFIGTALADELSRRNVQVTVPTRHYENARHLLMLPTVDVAIANIRNPAELRTVLTGCDAVVNLIGILHPGGGASFEDIHVNVPREVAQACADAGIRRLVHMSALNADPNGPSEYLRSRGRGEMAVRDEAAKAGLDLTIFRPSIVFGQGDAFLNLFADLVRRFPILPLGSPQAQFQPVHVEDVARAIAVALEKKATIGQTYCLCGPKVYTLRQLFDFVTALMRKSRTVIELGPGLSMLQAGVFEHLPGKLLTRDNVRSMSMPNVNTDPFPAIFGFQPAAMEAVVPQYLAGAMPRERYQLFRYAAGRSRQG